MTRLPARLIPFAILAAAQLATAQVVPSDADWKELEAPAPPAYDVSRLVEFDVSAGSSLRFGVDPATIRIGSDDVVRYVVVARSGSGALNAFFEGIRCPKGEFKTYARQVKGAGWVQVPEPTWRPMRDHTASRHTLRLAQQGACIGNATPVNAAEIIRLLKRDNPSSQPY